MKATLHSARRDAKGFILVMEGRVRAVTELKVRLSEPEARAPVLGETVARSSGSEGPRHPLGNRSRSQEVDEDAERRSRRSYRRSLRSYRKSLTHHQSVLLAAQQELVEWYISGPRDGQFPRKNEAKTS